MIFRYLYIFLSILYHFLSEIVEQTGQKVMGRYEPATRLAYSSKLFNYSLNDQFFIFMQFKSIAAVYQRTELLTDKLTGFAYIGS